MKADPQIAYEGYASATGGLTFDGRPMPTWEQLPERIQGAWKAALDAVPTLRFAESRLSFGAALVGLKAGKRVQRSGWNGKGMWLAYVPAMCWTIDRKVEECEMPKTVFSALSTDTDRFLSWIGMRTADRGFVPWLASQTDILAEDWSVLP